MHVGLLSASVQVVHIRTSRALIGAHFTHYYLLDRLSFVVHAVLNWQLADLFHVENARVESLVDKVSFGRDRTRH